VARHLGAGARQRLAAAQDPQRRSIDVTGISGEIEVDDLNGGITLKNVSGSVLAHSLNGPVTAVLDRVSPDKPMSFTSLNGKIDVTFPADTKARMRLKTDHGAVYSDFDMKMDPMPQSQSSRQPRAGWQVSHPHGPNVYGTINAGGPNIASRP